ncbi:MAG: NAD-dependent epimerase/dehydratase family protein [Cytophagales bacterium]|nr:NAD-dependent epimerase/dehydratase family protein [Cytophagales bacterium]
MDTKLKTIYALTGVTGLVGRNVFFEIIKDNINKLDEIELIVLGRGSANVSLKERVKNIFCEEGIDYLAIDKEEVPKIDLFLDSQVDYINIDLSASETISQEEYSRLLSKQINNFFHIAASTDFRMNPSVIEYLNEQNVYGTEKILKLCTHLNISTFNYISSAYACGCTYGNISPDHSNINQGFRNHYEKTKLQGELLVKEYEKNTGVKCRIFRPSTISGNLLENKKGTIYKFDVFYAAASYFLRLKMKIHSDVKDLNLIYEKETKLNLRVLVNLNAGLNIVPADFVSKILYQVCKQDIDGDYFHLVNNQETKHHFYLNEILKMLNITGCTFVDTLPQDLSPDEEFYYKTIGKILTPYIHQEEMNFDVSNLQSLYQDQKINCPEIDKKNFEILLNFAKSKNFGVTI